MRLSRAKLEVVFSVVILAIALVWAIVPGWLAPTDPNRIGVGDLLEASSLAHLMGPTNSDATS